MLVTKLAATLIIVALAGWRGTESSKQDAYSLIQDMPTRCPVGNKKSKELDSCVPCSAGSFKNIPGDFDCSACPVGTFARKTGLTACHLCPVGTFASETGSTACSLCGIGTFSSSGAVSCMQCPAGTYSSGSGSSECTKCSAGTYSSSSGSTTCTKCAAGTYSRSSGSTSCSKCAPGTYSRRDGATQCKQCDLNFSLRRYSGMAHCDLCPDKTTAFSTSKCYSAKRIGCFKEKSNPRDLGLFQERSNKNTPDYCVKVCRSEGYAYAGVQAYNWCYCGNSYGRHGKVHDSECTMNCQGDSKQTCGNHWRNEIYSTGVNAVRRLGCFKDKASRDLPYMEKLSGNTPQLCIENCRSKEYTYAGVQASTWCLCGNSYGRYGKLPDSKCSLKCLGDGKQTCGHHMKNEVYSTGLNHRNRN